MPISIDRELSQLRNRPGLRWVYLGLNRLVSQVNQLATNLGGDTGAMPPPPNIASLTVKSSGTGLVHAMISDPGNVSRNLQYFVEYDTNPAFTQPQVVHMGASRGALLHLPGKNDGGDGQNFYFRGYSQYPGSQKPSDRVVYGSTTTPTAVAPGGTDTLTLIPSTGSGTAANSGQEGGSGLGQNLKRNLVG